MRPETRESRASLGIEKSGDVEEPQVKPFARALSEHGLVLERDETKTLQINVGFLCNQVCRHCHLGAGPDRKEIMNLETASQVVSYASRGKFDTIDVTGGAPELNSQLEFIIKELAPSKKRLMIRSNLSALNDGTRSHLFDVFRDNRVVVVASFPSLNRGQADSLRGKGIFDLSIEALQKLNTIGYGVEGSGLELDLVSNPSGAFLPSSQADAEARFRDVLRKKWGIEFNNLFNFANVPLGRFKKWLEDSGNLIKYLEKLEGSFNPCAVEAVMCRTMISVSWDGYLYDCDFNLAGGLPFSGQKTHISEVPGPPEPGMPIAVADHCYSCTAGSGFT
ncbi:arsenosugar biosynthesis radical SAM (seleno)protein ArsS [Thermodesulfobacteriota bacterium]